MAIGTVGLMVLEGWGVVASFYFMALLATAEGPAATPASDAGKIFAAKKNLHNMSVNKKNALCHRLISHQSLLF